MGSIGDQLGIDLTELLDMDEPPQSDQEDNDTVGEAVMNALLEETSIEPDRMRADLTLEGDLDLDTLGRYSVISQIEHELGITLIDRDVGALTTVEDLLNLARSTS